MRVAAFDWSEVESEFSLQIATWRQSTQKRTKIKRDKAVAMMAAYYLEHKSFLPSAIQDFREHIIAELMAGESAEAAFAAIVKDLRFEQHETVVSPMQGTVRHATLAAMQPV